jgi:hypothetical protein
MTAPKNSRSWPGGAEYPFFPWCLVKKWRVVDPKMIVCKKSGGLLFSAKVQNHPGSTEIGRNLRKIQKYLWRLPQQNESWYVYPRVSTIYVGCFSKLSISCFGSCFTKKPYFGTLKKEKALFMGRNENWPPWHSSPSQGSRARPIWPRSDKLCQAAGRI